jgi:UDP-GlcNAc:undecaprenyl-phosphate GlcNAc-1-phosphate transferase
MNAPLIEFGLVITGVFLCSVVGTALMRQLAHRYGWVAQPRDDRWHRKPTALFGGLGFYPVFLIGTCWVLVREFEVDWAGGNFFNPPTLAMRLAIALLGGSLLMFLFGLLDDLKHFRPATKLTCELLAASLFIFAGGVFPLTGSVVIDTLVTYFWFVGVINATNMLDNMDGLASGVGIIAGGTLLALTLGAGRSVEPYPIGLPVSAVLVAALLGFWWHNRPPATIFMGDSGSLFLGFVLAALSIPGSLNRHFGIQTGEMLLGPVLALLIPATVLAVPIFDTTLVTITRKWRAQKASQGGRDHSSHRLVGLGLPEKTTVWILYVFAALGGTVAILMQHFPAQALPLLGAFILTLSIVGVYLGHVKVQTVEPDRLPPAWTPLASTLLYKRRAGEVLLDTILVILCFHGAYVLRFEGVLPDQTLRALIESLPIVVASMIVVQFLAGIYRGQWRLFSISDLPAFAISALSGTTLSLALVTLVTRFPEGHSRSAYIIFGVLTFLAMVGSRLSCRLFDAILLKVGNGGFSRNRQPVLIYGAGKSGKMLFDEILSNPDLRTYTLVGFVEDDSHKVGRKLCGVPVLSMAQCLERAWNPAPEIWISSKFIPDTKALEVAASFGGEIVVRRARLQLSVVERHDQEFITVGNTTQASREESAHEVNQRVEAGIRGENRLVDWLDSPL